MLSGRKGIQLHLAVHRKEIEERVFALFAPDDDDDHHHHRLHRG